VYRCVCMFSTVYIGLLLFSRNITWKQSNINLPDSIFISSTRQCCSFGLCMLRCLNVITKLVGECESTDRAVTNMRHGECSFRRKWGWSWTIFTKRLPCYEKSQTTSQMGKTSERKLYSLSFQYAFQRVYNIKQGELGGACSWQYKCVKLSYTTSD